MSYGQARRLGWAILGSVFVWSVAIVLPAWLVYLAIFHSKLDYDISTPVISIAIALGVLVVLPLGIRDAIPGVYPDFRVSVAGSAGRRDRLTYFESLQIALVAVAIHGSFGILYYRLHLTEGFLGFLQLPLLALVVYPAIAAVIVRVPFSGFRILTLQNDQASQGAPTA